MMDRDEMDKWLATPSWAADVSADNLRSAIWRSILDANLSEPLLRTSIPVSAGNGMTASEAYEQMRAEEDKARIKAEYERFMQHLDEMKKRQVAPAGSRGPFGDPYGLGSIGGTPGQQVMGQAASLPPGGIPAPHPSIDDWDAQAAPPIEKPVKRIDETTFDDYKRGVAAWWDKRPKSW